MIIYWLLVLGLVMVAAGLVLDVWKHSPLLIAPGAVLVLMAGSQLVLA